MSTRERLIPLLALGGVPGHLTLPRVTRPAVMRAAKSVRRDSVGLKHSTFSTGHACASART